MLLHWHYCFGVGDAKTGGVEATVRCISLNSIEHRKGAFYVGTLQDGVHSSQACISSAGLAPSREVVPAVAEMTSSGVPGLARGRATLPLPIGASSQPTRTFTTLIVQRAVGKCAPLHSCPLATLFTWLYSLARSCGRLSSHKPSNPARPILIRSIYAAIFAQHCYCLQLSPPHTARFHTSCPHHSGHRPSTCCH